MNRRSFLSLLGSAAAAVTLDPERLLWEPGKRVTFDLWTPPAAEMWPLWLDPVCQEAVIQETLRMMERAHAFAARASLEYERRVGARMALNGGVLRIRKPRSLQ